MVSFMEVFNWNNKEETAKALCEIQSIDSNCNNCPVRKVCNDENNGFMEILDLDLETAINKIKEA